MKNSWRRLAALALALGMVLTAFSPGVYAADVSGDAAQVAEVSEAETAEAEVSEAEVSEAETSEAETSEAEVSEAEMSEAEVSEAEVSEAETSVAETSVAEVSEAEEAAPEAQPDAALAPAEGGYDRSAPHVVIAQVYGSKGTSEVLSHDFIELYNATDADVSLAGWSVQYREAGSTGAWQKLPLSGTIPARCSYLIRCAASSAQVDAARTLSRYDAQWDLALNNKGLSVALLSTTDDLPPESAVYDNSTNAPTVAGYVDLLSVAGGSKPAQIPAVYEGDYHDWQSKKIGIRRKSLRDTDDNKADTEKADYSAADVSELLPKCTQDGVWGLPVEQLRRARRQVPRFTEVYCTQESAAVLAAALEAVDAAITREESDPATADALAQALEQAVDALVYRHDETIAQVYLTTDNGRGASYGSSLTKSIGYVPAAVVVADQTGSCPVLDRAAQVKVRGNSTSRAPKKPYNIKLSAKAGLFGMDASKKWVLLADYYDPTLMRNSVAMEICKALGFPTPDYRRVEVWMDGHYQGVYLLTQKMEDVVTLDENGFLVEMDVASRIEPEDVYVTTGSGQLYRLRDPEDPAAVDAVKAQLDRVESVLQSGKQEDVEAVLDVDSFVDYYLINEFMRNPDFRKISVFFHQKDGKLYAGPEWDNDLSMGLFMGNKLSPVGPTLESAHVYRSLIAKKWFRRRVSARYPQFAQVVKPLCQDDGWIDRQAAQYAEAIARNYTVWQINYTNSDVADPYGVNLDYLKQWMVQREQWFDGYSDQFGTEIVQEDGALYYYRRSSRCAAGLVLYAGEYYYAGPGGRILTGQVDVTETNDLPFPAGTYTFDEQTGIMLNVPLRYEAVYQPYRAPTCTQYGLRECWYVARTGRYYADEACTKPIATNLLSMTFHEWSDAEVVTKATTEQDGTQKRTCRNCGMELEEPIPMLSVLPPEPEEDLEYTGRKQALVTQGYASDGELVYSLREDGGYSPTVPAHTNAGDYTVWYKVNGGSRCEDTLPRPLYVTIEKARRTTPAAPKLLRVSPTELSVHVVAGQEYSRDGGKTWRRSGHFAGLHPFTRYSVVTRRVEDANHYPSASSAPAAFRTLNTPAVELNRALALTQSGSALRLRWGAVTNADRYEIWVQEFGKRFDKKPTLSVKSNRARSVSLTRLKGKKLNLSGGWQAVVKAKQGKKTLAVSLTLHAVGRRHKRYTNAGRIDLSTDSLRLQAGKKGSIRAKTVRVSPKKRLLPNSHESEFRYLSGDRTVATVNSRGQVTGVAPGACVVYVYARNGLAKQVRVRVT